MNQPIQDQLTQEQLDEMKALLEKNPNGFLIPDNLRPACFLPQPKVDCRRCPKGYIIPEPTPQELLVKAQQAKIEEQSQAINTLTESLKLLSEHLGKLTTAFNEVVKEK
jgi:hypothetical protein